MDASRSGYFCTACNYSTNIKANYIKHMSTRKHNKNCTHHIRNHIRTNPCISSSLLTTESSAGIDSSEQSVPFVSFDGDARIVALVNEMKSIKEQIGFLVNSNKDKDLVIERQNSRIMALESAVKMHPRSQQNKAVNVSGVNGNVTVDQSTHNTVNIQITPFGKESWDHLDQETVLKIMKGVNECIPELLRRIHFDDNHPENRNIKIPNKKLSTIETFNGSTWETKPKLPTIDGWIKDAVDRLDYEYADDFKKQASSFLWNLWMQKYSALTNSDDKNHARVSRETRKSVECVILSNRDTSRNQIT